MKARFVEQKTDENVYYYIVTIIDGYADEAMVDVYGDPENGRTLLYKNREMAVFALETAVKYAAKSISKDLEATDITFSRGDVVSAKLRSKRGFEGYINAYIAEAVVV